MPLLDLFLPSFGYCALVLALLLILCVSAPKSQQPQPKSEAIPESLQRYIANQLASIKADHTHDLDALQSSWKIEHQQTLDALNEARQKAETARTENSALATRMKYESIAVTAQYDEMKKGMESLAKEKLKSFSKMTKKVETLKIEKGDLATAHQETLRRVRELESQRQNDNVSLKGAQIATLQLQIQTLTEENDSLKQKVEDMEETGVTKEMYEKYDKYVADWVNTRITERLEEDPENDSKRARVRQGYENRLQKLEAQKESDIRRESQVDLVEQSNALKDSFEQFKKIVEQRLEKMEQEATITASSTRSRLGEIEKSVFSKESSTEAQKPGKAHVPAITHVDNKSAQKGLKAPSTASRETAKPILIRKDPKPAAVDPPSIPQKPILSLPSAASSSKQIDSARVSKSTTKGANTITTSDTNKGEGNPKKMAAPKSKKGTGSDHNNESEIAKGTANSAAKPNPLTTEGVKKEANTVGGPAIFKNSNTESSLFKNLRGAPARSRGVGLMPPGPAIDPSQQKFDPKKFSNNDFNLGVEQFENQEDAPTSASVIESSSKSGLATASTEDTAKSVSNNKDTAEVPTTFKKPLAKGRRNANAQKKATFEDDLGYDDLEL
ncbi:hypothetical protein P154DRAFT_588369 [Amniculicola lignicola CBS 123094]|uniref:Uncharacterized protein n=1 Tax=Amniculicola lignicola CBS 123094 TaxID=1392246 RepID=A0A6A5W3E8_9PLEO|nr:hypothetical protein P154DRAFT_588369 [Amniculicola lignicola CBS 123094]